MKTLHMSGSPSDIAQATLQSQTIVNSLVLNLLVQIGAAEREVIVSFLEVQAQTQTAATAAILNLLADSLANDGVVGAG